MAHVTRSGRCVKPTAKMAEILNTKEQSVLIDVKLQLEQQKIENEILRTQLEISRTEGKLRHMSSLENSNTHCIVYPASKAESRVQPPQASTESPVNASAPPQQPPELNMQFVKPSGSPVQYQLDPKAQPFVSSLAQPERTLNTVQPSRGIYVTPEPLLCSTPAHGDQAQLNATIQQMNMISRLTLPRLEPEVFSGDLIKFPIWMKSFETLIEGNAILPAERLYFLSKYTSGEAKEAIQGYFMLDDDKAYRDAKRTLISRYGDRYRAAEAFKCQIHNWPEIKPGDNDGLQKLADFLHHCSTAMNTLSHLQCLDSADENRKILRKLPRYMVDRWNRVVDRWLYGPDSTDLYYEGRYPPFAEFCKFLSKEARIARGPGNAARLESVQARKPANSRQTATHVFSTSTETEKQVEEKLQCYFCGELHHLSSCAKFKSMNLAERRSHAMSKGKCFSCLRSGHLRTDCHRKGKPLLYMYMELPTQRKSEDTEKMNSEEKKSISLKTEVHISQPTVLHSPIVKVEVHHRDNRSQVVQTYAMLDSQSNSCFITETLANSLSVPRYPVNLQLTTMLDKKTVKSDIIKGLVVRGVKESKQIELPGTYTRTDIPADDSLIPKPETVQKWSHLKTIAGQLPRDENPHIGLLIGFNCSSALLPKEVIAGKDNDPYAIRTNLGWGVTGSMNDNSSEETQDGIKRFHSVFRTHVKEVIPDQVREMFEVEFFERNSEEKISVEDRRFLEQMDSIYQRKDGHFELPLPLKDDVDLPNNKALAMKRLFGLKTRMKKNDQFRSDYVTFMTNLISKGHAEKVPLPDNKRTSGKVWYIPHQGVYHTKKPGKIRVVFDCSAEFKGEVINRHLLRGPDLINNLVGVLCRFRQEDIALSCDIEGMFHQIGVREEHRDFLRFLWFEDGDTESQPTEYRMTVHLFGATSSPACANFALKTAANIYQEKWGKKAADFVRKDFYVDDGLKSVPTEIEAKELINNTRELCRDGGFNLHKFACTDRSVLKEIPAEQKDKSFQEISLDHDKLPISRTLGVQWCIENDVFQFRIELKAAATRRGILSAISSIFDPLGLVSPFLLTGRRLLQEVCRDKFDWDDTLPDEIQHQWRRWCDGLLELGNLSVPRCYKPRNFKPEKAELHHFSDASNKGYGQCSYLRLHDADGDVATSLVMAKSRVPPTKPVTIPRMELTAAVVSVKVAAFLDKELDYEDITHVFWTDSKVVLGYIANEAKRFHVFVANRIQQIKENSESKQWKYVNTQHNPADLASRGMSSEELVRSNMWWRGPSFLQSGSFPEAEMITDLSETDPEVKRNVASFATETHLIESCLLTSLKSYSDWHKAKKTIALCQRFIKKLREAVVKSKETGGMKKNDTKAVKQDIQPVSAEELHSAEVVIIKAVQQGSFPKEVKLLTTDKSQSFDGSREDFRSKKGKIKQVSSLYRLDPFMSEDGLMRVGGRIRRANVPRDVAHPIILPRNGQVAKLIARYYHDKTLHAGVNTTISEVRSNGFWIIGIRQTVGSIVHKCVTCKKLRGATAGQKMSDLPQDRLEPSPPFTYSGVDYFGPFYVKEKRSEKKRWGCLFTCMVSRAIHIEVAQSLSTDSFINAYRRFVARRGSIQQLRCDCGSNFIGAKNEMSAALSEFDHHKIHSELLKDRCDWINFKTNVPHASHMGGTWERMIRSARNVLCALLDQHGHQLDDELLHTLLVEAESIVNSRPLTPIDAKCPEDESLSPSQLLTLKSKVAYPLPGVFVKEDVYCRKRWRCVQYLANQFWTRWLTEYLPNLQKRQKWSDEKDNVQEGDVVLVVGTDTPRSQWPKGRVVEVLPSEDGLVRKVKVKVSQSVYERPVHKLILLFRPN